MFATEGQKHTQLLIQELLLKLQDHITVCEASIWNIPAV